MWTFKPIFKPTVWGGSRLTALKRAATKQSGIGECWEISGLPGYDSVVDSGIDTGKTLSGLTAELGAALLGERNYLKYGPHFPIIIKWIDAAQDLSVQVHPDDETASRLGFPSGGKTEMWYVADAEPGSRLANGFEKPLDHTGLDAMIADGSIADHIHYTEVAKGDAFFIPPGRVHSIGSGCLILEVQQASDVTFRVFDYNRPDAEGRLRQLHTEEARQALDLTDCGAEKICYKAMPDVPVTLVASPCFTVNLLSLDEETIRDYSEWDTFVVLVATDGEADVACRGRRIRLCRGDSVLIPASAENLTITPCGSFTAIETYIK